MTSSPSCAPSSDCTSSGWTPPSSRGFGLPSGASSCSTRCAMAGAACWRTRVPAASRCSTRRRATVSRSCCPSRPVARCHRAPSVSHVPSRQRAQRGVRAPRSPARRRRRARGRALGGPGRAAHHAPGAGQRARDPAPDAGGSGAGARSRASRAPAVACRRPRRDRARCRGALALAGGDRRPPRWPPGSGSARAEVEAARLETASQRAGSRCGHSRRPPATPPRGPPALRRLGRHGQVRRLPHRVSPPRTRLRRVTSARSRRSCARASWPRSPRWASAMSHSSQRAPPAPGRARHLRGTVAQPVGVIGAFRCASKVI